jgi:hypothetical protein
MPDHAGKLSMKKNLLLLLILSLIILSPIIASAQTPALTLKDSIPVAEEALVKNQINASLYFIFSVTYTNSNKGYFWYYTFRSVDNPSMGRDIHLKIYMDKTVEVINSSKS